MLKKTSTENVRFDKEFSRGCWQFSQICIPVQPGEKQVENLCFPEFSKKCRPAPAREFVGISKSVRQIAEK